MKNLMIATVLGLATATSAFASTSANELPYATKIEAQRALPGASFDDLSVAQRVAVESILAGGKDNAGIDIPAALKKVVN